MKKLLTILSVVTLTSSSVASVVACQTGTEVIKTRINGNITEEDTLNNPGKEEVSSTSLYDNAYTGKIASLSYQLMNAITFTESKYTDKSKLAAAQETMGPAGLALSLDNLENDESRTDDLNEFLESYNAPRNTNFTEINYVTKTNNIFDIGAAPVFLVDRHYKDGSLYEDTIVETNFDYEEKENDWYSKLKTTELVTDLETLKSGSTVSQWKTALNKSDEEINEASKEANLNDTEKNQAKTFFTKMKDVSEKKVKLMGNFAVPTQVNMDIVAADKEDGQLKKDEISTQWSLYSSTTGEDNKIKINTGNTFVYNTGGNFADLELTFVDNVSKNEDPKVFTIKYEGLNNIVLNYAINGIPLKTGSGNEERTDKYIYWYEPVGYSFKDEKNTDNKNLFKVLEGFDAQRDISVTKK